MRNAASAAFATLALIGMLVVTPVAAQAGPSPPVVGCYRDDAESPSFVVTPGVKVENSPVPCITACAKMGFSYAMVGRVVCVCGQDLTRLTVLGNATCDYKCDPQNVTGYNGPCGGSRGANTVFDADSMAKISSWAIQVIPGTTGSTDQTFTVNLQMNGTARSNLDYIVDFGEGGGPQKVPASSSAVSIPRYSLPGTYIVTAQAKWTTLDGIPALARTRIRVTEVGPDWQKPLNPQVPATACNDSLVELGKQFTCLVSVARGAPSDGSSSRHVRISANTSSSNMQLSSSFGSGIRMAGMNGRRYGAQATMASVVADGVNTANMSNTVLMTLNPMLSTANLLPGFANLTLMGYIVSIRANIFAAPNSGTTVNFTLERPSCSGGTVYCPFTQLCESACDTTCVGTGFVVKEGRCQVASPSAGLAPTYTTVVTLRNPTAVTTVVSNVTGVSTYNVFAPPISLVPFRSGDVVKGVCSAPDCNFLGRRARPGEPSQNGWVPFLSVHVFEPMPYSVPIKCPSQAPTAATFTPSLSYWMTSLTTVTTSSVSPKVTCQDPVINLTVTPDKQVARVGEPIVLTITASKGNPINATVEAAKVIQLPIFNASATAIQPITYTAPGVYNVVVKAQNLWTGVAGNDFDNVSLSVIVQYPVTPNWTFAVLSQDEYILPANVTFEITFSGANLATNATAIIDYGDGSPLETVPVTSRDFYVSHYYGVDDSQGNYTTTVNISNLVDTQLFMVSYLGVQGPFELFKPIQNLTLEFAYFMAGDSNPRAGGGLNGLDFPSDYNITCSIILPQGIVETYELLLNGTVINRITVADRLFPFGYNFTLFLPLEGYYNSSARAKNKLQGWVYSDEVYTLHMISDVRDVQIDDFRIMSPPRQPKTFEITYGSTGGSSCLFIVWGDGGIGNTYGDSAMCSSIPSELAIYKETTIVSPFRVNHTYDTENIYTIRGSAFNIKSKAEFTLDVTIVDTQGLECFKPTVSILTPAVGGHNYIRSKTITLDGQFQLNCSGLVTRNLSWSITEISDSVSRTVIRKLDTLASDVSSWDKIQLAIPPLYLTAGIFEVGFNVRMAGKRFLELWPIQNAYFTDIKVDPSPLQILITPDGATKKLVAKNGVVNLPARDSSMDPDDPNAVLPITFEWICALANETVDPLSKNFTVLQNIPNPALNKSSTNKGGCFGLGPGKLNTSAGILTFNALSFYKGGQVYKLYVVGKKDNRTGFSAVELEVSNWTAPMPDVVIGCLVEAYCTSEPTENGFLTVAASSRLSFTGSCPIGCDDALNISYKWRMEIKNAFGVYANLTLDTTLVPRGWTSNVLLLETEFLTFLKANSPSWAFSLRLDVTLDNGKKGFAVRNNAIVKPPQGGRCWCSVPSVTPLALKDTFTCQCSGWVDPQQKRIITYAYYSLDSSTPPVRNELGTSSNGENTLVVSAGATSIRCALSNELGASTDTAVDIYAPPDLTTPIKPGSLSVRNPSLQELQDLAGAPEMTKLLAENPVMATKVAAVVASAVISSPATVIDLGTMSVTEVTAKMDQVSAAMTSVLTSQQQLTIASPAAAVGAVSTLSQVVGALNPSDPRSSAMSQASLTAIADIALSVNEVLKKTDPPPSPQQQKQMMSGLLATIDGLGPSMNSLTSQMGSCEESAANLDTRFCLSSDQKAAKVDLPFPPTNIKQVQPSDDKMIRCCAQAQTRGTLIEKANTQLVATTITAAQTFVKTLVPNETNTITSPSGSVLTAAMKSPADLLSAPLVLTPAVGGPVSISFPQLPCAAEGCGAPVPVVAGVLPVNTLTGSGIGDSQRVKADSQLFFAGVVGAEVKDLPDPIVFTTTASCKPSPNEPVFTFRNTQDELVNSTAPIVYTVMEFKEKEGEQVSVKIEFEEDVSKLNLFLIVQRGRYPVPIAGQFEVNNSKALSNMKHSIDGVYTHVCDVDGNKTGNLFFGLLELKKGLDLTQIAGKANYDNFKDFINEKLNVSFYLKPTILAASYFDETENAWKSAGCKVEEYEECGAAKISSTHLTTFGTGFFVKPNMVDFAYVFAHAGFEDNLTIYLTLIFSVAVYIVIMIWARRADKRDKERIGSLPLPDNNPNDKYIYELLVQTGDKNSSETDSKVQFILSGEDDETEVRTLADPKTSPREVFDRGSLDAFVLACPRPLGNLNYLRIWHDNTGKGGKQSWFFSYMAVRDVQTGAVFEFICNNWLAVEKADGQIDRLIPVSGESDKKNFSFLFNTTSSKNLRDNHLWFSVFMRPHRSRFTRVQRVSSCMALLYLSMLTNAMFYGVLPEKPGQGSLKVGPFALSPEQLGVGFMSTLICFPPALIIVQLFRKSRPRRLRKSRITEALAKDGRQLDPEKKGTIPRKKAFTFPWWCRILAWILVAVCFCVSVFFLWAYGIQFGNEKATKWVSSLIFSFFSSILLVEPIKILALAAFFSLICKDADTDSDDADADEEDPQLEWDESYLAYDGAKKDRKLDQKVPTVDLEVLEEARRKRLNEMKMWSLMKEMIFYTFYLMIVIVLSYGDQDPHANRMQGHLRRTFTRPGTQRMRFEQVDETDKWWNWTENVLLQELRAQNWYNGDPAYGLSGFLNDRANRILGYAVIRQVRVKPNSCDLPRKVYGFVTECSGLAGIGDDSDNRNYCPGWKDWEAGCKDEEYWYTNWKKLESFPWIGTLDTYSGGGYVLKLVGRESDIHARFAQLKQQGWIDKYTRAVFIEFPVYNAQVNLFAAVRLSSEMIPGGGMTSKMRADVFRLISHGDGFALFVMICEASFVLFTLYFTVQIGKGIYRDRLKFFKKYWNLTDIAQILISYTAIVAYLIRMSITSNILKYFEETQGNAYTRLDQVKAVQSIFSESVAGLAFLAIIMFIKLLRYNKTIMGFSLMFKKCWDDLIGFGFVFLILFLAFVSMFHLFFAQLLRDWNTFIGAAGTSFSILLGKFDFTEIRDTNIVASVLFFVFNIMMSIIMINLMLAIIIMAFQEVEKEMAQAQVEREFEVIPFLLARARGFLGLSARTAPVVVNQNRVGQGKPEIKRHAQVANVTRARGSREKISSEKLKELPQKMDLMLDYLNNIYFDGQVDIHNKEWLKEFKNNQGKTLKRKSNANLEEK